MSRRIAFSVLHTYEKKSSFRLKLPELIESTILSCQHTLNRQDHAFCYALTHGVLRHWFKLEDWMLRLSRRPAKKIEPKVRTLIKMGLFQLYGLSNVPAYAAVNSTLELGKHLKCSVKGIQFINGVLRSASRELEESTQQTTVQDNPIDSKTLLQSYGWPAQWLQCLQPQYSLAEIHTAAEASQAVSTGLSIRVNTLRMTPDTYLQQLQNSGFNACQPEPDHLPEWIWIEQPAVSPDELPGYKEGYYYIQERSSMAVARWLDPKPEQTVLDLCAAPGSKTTHLAALMNNQGHIFATDTSATRLQKLESNLSRLGISNVTVQRTISNQPHDENSLAEGKHYDHVLVDAPCSASGTIRRHPEVLLQICQQPEKASRQHTDTQSILLKKGFTHLKPGGTLIYSTCSLFRYENQKIVQDFLHQEPDAQLLDDIQQNITNRQDGFYMAKLTRQVKHE